MKTIKVYPCGTKVAIEDTIKGFISAHTMRWNNIIYEITWWEAGARKTEWCNETEFNVIDKDAKANQIGFH